MIAHLLGRVFRAAGLDSDKDLSVIVMHATPELRRCSISHDLILQCQIEGLTDKMEEPIPGHDGHHLVKLPVCLILLRRTRVGRRPESQAVKALDVLGGTAKG